MKAHVPYHRHRESQDHKVDQQVGHPIPAIELGLIDTATARDGFVPEVCHGLALEDGYEEVHDEIGEHNELGSDQRPAEAVDDGEDAVVQQDERCLDGEGRGEVEDLEGEKDLEFRRLSGCVKLTVPGVSIL